MKQHITVEQLNQISDEKFQKLTELMGAKGKVIVFPIRVTTGKLIELLYKYDCDVKIESAGAMWYVEVAAHIKTKATELVDALWKAVKEVL